MANSITVDSSSHVTACAFSSPDAGRTQRQLQAQPAPGSLVPRPFEASQLDLSASFRLVTAVQLPTTGSDLNPGTSSLSGIFGGMHSSWKERRRPAHVAMPLTVVIR